MDAAGIAALVRDELGRSELARSVRAGLDVRGQAVAVGTGVSTADVAVLDGLGTAAKLAVGTCHVGGTYVADEVLVTVLSTDATSTTFRAKTRAGGNIAAGATVLIDYRIWRG